MMFEQTESHADVTGGNGIERFQFAMTLTYRCNWDCCYCAVRNSVDWKENVTREDVLHKIDAIPEGSIVTIFGGEPGILPRGNLVQYIAMLKVKKCHLKLETNGLFISRYPDLLEHFDQVTYHCSEDLDEEDQILEVEHPDVRYMLVIHDDNFDKLDRFLQVNPFPEKFYMVEATYPHERTGPTLSTENKNALMTRYSRRITNEGLQRLMHGFNFDDIIFLT